MPPSLGPAVGKATDLLFELTQIVRSFRSDLDRLNSTLCLIKSVVHDVDYCNEVLDRSQQETQALADLVMEGEKLVQRCFMVRSCDIITKVRYSKEMRRLEASLVRFTQVDVAALHLLESKKISVAECNLDDKMNKMLSNLEDISVAVSNLEDKMNKILITLFSWVAIAIVACLFFWGNIHRLLKK